MGGDCSLRARLVDVGLSGVEADTATRVLASIMSLDGRTLLDATKDLVAGVNFDGEALAEMIPNVRALVPAIIDAVMGD